MMFQAIEAIYLALAFIVPGFILRWVLSMFTVRRMAASELNWVRYLTLSAINYGVWSWLVYLLISAEFFRERPNASAATWGIVIFVGPVLIGVFLGYMTQKDWGYRLLQSMGLRPVHTIPTAWDWLFSRMVESHWVLVTLQDGSQVAGLFSGSSFASSDPEERDLYIEQVYELDENGAWLRGQLKKGILVKDTEIRFLEAWPIGETGR